jgi:hypothetical protein
MADANWSPSMMMALLKYFVPSDGVALDCCRSERGRKKYTCRTPQPAGPQSLPVVNPDNINKLYPERGGGYAGREAILQQEDRLSCGTSFIIETTISGQRELQLVKAAKSKGYVFGPGI